MKRQSLAKLLKSIKKVERIQNINLGRNLINYLNAMKGQQK